MYIRNLGFKDVLYEQPLKMERFVISLYKICAEDGKVVVELFEPEIKFFLRISFQTLKIIIETFSYFYFCHWPVIECPPLIGFQFF
jgi:hypothetical protein